MGFPAPVHGMLPQSSEPAAGVGGCQLTPQLWGFAPLFAVVAPCLGLCHGLVQFLNEVSQHGAEFWILFLGKPV